MLGSLRIVFIVRSYLHFLCSCFTRLCDVKYSYLMQIIFTQLYAFKSLIIILIMLSKQLYLQVTIVSTNNLHGYIESSTNDFFNKGTTTPDQN